MSQLCRVNQDPDEISGLLEVIEMKGLRSPRIDYKESIPVAYVAWRVDTTPLFLLGF